MKLSFSLLLASIAVANARELRALQETLQNAGESDTDVNQGAQSQGSLAETLRRQWLVDTPTITYESDNNHEVVLSFLESTDKLTAPSSIGALDGNFQAQFYDFKCRNDGTTTYANQFEIPASDSNGLNGFGESGMENMLWSVQDGIEWDWTVYNPTKYAGKEVDGQGNVVYGSYTNPTTGNPSTTVSQNNGISIPHWENIPNNDGNPAGKTEYDQGNWNNNVNPPVFENWDPNGVYANDEKHDFPPCKPANGCPGFPKLTFNLSPGEVANNVRVYEIVGKHPGVSCDGTTCQSRLDPSKTYPDADKGKGIMRFCVRTNVGYFTDNASNPGGSVSDPLNAGLSFREVNFLETLVTIKYNLEAGFTIDAFAVEPKLREEVTAIKDSYQLEAYLCNPEDRHLQDIEALPGKHGLKLNDGDGGQPTALCDSVPGTVADSVAISGYTGNLAMEGLGPAAGVSGCKETVWMPGATTDPGFWEGNDNLAQFQMQSMDACAAMCYENYQSQVFGYTTGYCRCGTVQLGDINAAVTRYTGPCGSTNAMFTDCISNQPCTGGGWCTCPVTLTPSPTNQPELDSQPLTCDPAKLRNVPRAITKYNTGSKTGDGEENFVNAQPDNLAGLTANPTASPGTATDAFNQGALITVCVRPDAATFKDGVRLASLQTFDWYRDVPAVKQQAIVGGAESPNMLTAYNSAGPGVAKFSNHVQGFAYYPHAYNDLSSLTIGGATGGSNTNPNPYLPPYTGGGQCQNPITTAADCQLAWAQYQTSAPKLYDSNGFEMFGGVGFPEGCVAVDHTVWGGAGVYIYFMTSGSSGQCGVKDGIPSTSVQCLCREPVIPTVPTFTHGLCQDAAEWCSFSSILFADFYKNAGEVFGVGTAFLEFGRRRLEDANKPDGDAARKLQESEGSSPFDLVVRTNMADDGPGALKTAGGASYGVTLVTTAMALLSAAAVLA